MDGEMTQNEEYETGGGGRIVEVPFEDEIEGITIIT